MPREKDGPFAGFFDVQGFGIRPAKEVNVRPWGGCHE